ncbi:predicted ATPase (AAA-family) [Helicobacter bizzozeronii CCUG 35545]|nr:predicted ATPase (AAA-family) [Helicobacter bizzozeronii CCUG 35545]
MAQEGHSAQGLLDITPYEDHLDYFNDWFLKIELLYKLAMQNKQPNSPASLKIQEQLQLLEHKINARNKLTKTPLSVQKFLQKHNLSLKEQIIFFCSAQR